MLLNLLSQISWQFQVSDNHNLKIFDASTFSFKYKISFPYMIHKFKRIDSSRVLLVTGTTVHLK